MGPLLTIQIVGWNSAKKLPMALASLQQIPAAAALIRYLDNASRDDSVALVRAMLPQAEVVELPRNRGFAGGHNIGFARCTTPYVLLLNPDASLMWEGVQQLLTAFADEDIGAVQGKIYRCAVGAHGQLDRPPIFDSAGINMTLALNGIDRGAGDVDRGQFDTPTDVAALTGAVGLYRVAALRSVAHGEDEVFDEEFFAYKEDVDLGWRLRRAGWRVRYMPVAMAHHERSLGRGTAAGWGWQPRRVLARLRDGRTALSLRNWLWLLVKNLSWRTALAHAVFITLRLLIFIALTMVYWPLWRVWRDAIDGLPRMTAKR